MHDDQKMAIWHHIRHPEVISLSKSGLSGGFKTDIKPEVGTTSMECMFKQDVSRFAIRGDSSGEASRWLYVDGQKSSVGLMHFNGGSLTRQLMHR